MSRKKSYAESKSYMDSEYQSLLEEEEDKSVESTTDIESLQSVVERNFDNRIDVFSITRSNPYIIKLKIEEGKQDSELSEGKGNGDFNQDIKDAASMLVKIMNNTPREKNTINLRIGADHLVHIKDNTPGYKFYEGDTPTFSKNTEIVIPQINRSETMTSFTNFDPTGVGILPTPVANRNPAEPSEEEKMLNNALNINPSLGKISL